MSSTSDTSATNARVRFLGLVPPPAQLLVLNDPRFVRDEQRICSLEPAVLLVQQLRLSLERPVLLVQELRPGIANVQGRHPNMKQTCDEQQRDGVEHAVDEQRLAQPERTARYLQRVGDERHEHERDRHPPQQPAIASAFETIPVGTSVTWHYRSAIGHGTVIGLHKIGTTADNTMYSVRQHDHHPGEPDILHHSGKALSVVKS